MGLGDSRREKERTLWTTSISLSISTLRLLAWTMRRYSLLSWSLARFGSGFSR